MKKIYNYAACLMVLAGISGVSESSAQCTVTINSGSSCSLPTVLTVAANFPVARIEWRRGGNLQRTDSVRYPATGVRIAGTGAAGSASNQTGNPSAVFLDSLHNLYVCEVYFNRISKWSPGAANGTTIAGGNAAYPPSTLKDLFRPMGCVIDPVSGNLYVADMTNNRVMRFPAGSTAGSNGTIAAGGNSSGNLLNQFNTVVDVALDAAGNIYVADLLNHRVLKFPANSTKDTMGVIVAGGNGQGPQLNKVEPHGIFVDAAGNLFVADVGNSRILKFPPGSDKNTQGTVVAGGNGAGVGLHQFSRARDVYVDKLGYIYVADDEHFPPAGTYKTNRILRFPPNSTSATSGVLLTSGLEYPTVHVSDSGHVFIPEYNRHHVLKLTASITDTFTATTAGTYEAKVYGFNGCVVTQTIVVGGGAPTFVSGSNPAVCAGGTSAVLSLSSITGSPDQYSISWSTAAQTAGFSNVTNSSFSGSSVNISVPGAAAPATYSGTLSLRNSTSGCASASANISVVVSLNGPVFTVGTAPVVCLGANSAVLNLSNITGSPNQYSISWNTAAQTAGFGNVTNQSFSGSSINISVPGAAAPATYSGTLTMRNSTSGCISGSANISVSVSPLPVATVTPAGPLEICVGQTETLTAGSGTGYSYEWKSNQGVMGSGATYAAGSAGDYYVVVTDGNNCKDSSAVVMVSQLALPQGTVTPGDTSFCSGGYVRLEVATTDTGLGYQWKDGNALLSATANFIEVNTSGDYSVVLSRNSIPGCKDSTLPVVVTVHPLPQPSIEWDGSILKTVSAYSSYQWLISGQPIVGAINQTYVPDTTGSYSVSVVDSNGCENISASYQVNELSGVGSVSVSGEVRIYPNPAGGVVHVKSPVFVEVMIRNMEGKVVSTGSGNAVQMHMEHLSDGIYLITVSDRNGSILLQDKLVKQSR